MNRIFSVLLAAGVLFSGACRAQERVPVVRHAEGEQTLLLSKSEAGEAVLQDRYDRFFDRITPVELSIQWKKPLADFDEFDQEKAQFENFLKSDMDDFTPAESAWVAEIMEQVYTMVESVFPGLYPDKVWLAKTKARHYGESVYYTRGDGIVIPYDALEDRNEAAFRTTMLHELFHVYSRLHPEKRKELYALIGFTSIGYDNLLIPATLAGRLLHNPDGVDFAQKIDLRQSDSSVISAIPIIYANQDGYQPAVKEFFGYLEFALFPVEKDKKGKWTVKTNADGLSSPIDLRTQPDFFRQIRENTSYIIHPDEILADNFAFIVKSKRDPAVTARFSDSGKALLQEIEAVLKK